ncbi:hypothetical protein Vretimale_13323 [Volvox reticuliferus]|uniref:Uncharacterized protein n=1 Tax=Volvox reticuliferus TaxID=1737510 RepID=A0A8J4GM78_9CHLO|nr:hypothetical protein Vretimale_13323 [Volvox reticuliferus]
MIRRQKQEQESPRTYPALTSLLTKYKEALGQNILQSNPLATPFPDANASISPDRSPPTGPFLSASTSTLSSPRSPGMCYGATAARQNAGCPFHTVFDASATTSATSIIAASVSATPPSISPALRRGLHLAPPAPANALAGTMSSPRAAAGVANTPNATSPITDLLIQRFGRAQSASHVLQLLEEGRALASQCGCESLQLLLYTAALGAMARCLAAPPAGNPAVEGEGGDAGGGNGGIAPQGDELLELQWTVSEVLREMHGRRWLMSYKKIAAMLASLLVVLPALDWPVDDQRIISDIAARLAPAASAANKLAPVPLGKLCGAFRSLALLAEAASSRGRGFTPDVMREAGSVPDDDLGAKEPIDSPRGPYEYVSGAAASGRGVAPITTGSRSHHLGPSAGSPAGAAPEAHASDLDIASLLRVLVGWCSVKPGRPAPAQPWLRRHAGLVLRTQHAAAAGARLAELQEQLDRLDQKLESLLSEQEHFRAKAHTGVKSPDLSPASVSRMLLPAGCREPWGGAAAAVDTAAAGGSGRKRGGWTAADARLVLQGMGPGAAQAVTTILKAAAAANAEIAGLKQQLEALGVLGELVEQQQLQLQLVADGDLIDLLAALAVCVGNGAGQRLGSLAEAVIMARLEGLAPCQVLQVWCVVRRLTLWR